MDGVVSEMSGGAAVVTLRRGKVNALNGTVVQELRASFEALEADPEVRAVILTGHGPFFSFGFDIPEFLSFPKEQFTDYLIGFTDLYRYLFLYPKPVVAALNGHTIAGGCMLALACDHRVMVGGKARIGLNEIAFGSTVFAGSVELLRFWVGNAHAASILSSGAMYPASAAKGLGLIDEETTEDDLMPAARKWAAELGSKSLPAFTSIKGLLRKPVAEEMARREKQSVREFVEIWYSAQTRANLENIKIR